MSSFPAAMTARLKAEARLYSTIFDDARLFALITAFIAIYDFCASLNSKVVKAFVLLE